MSVVVNEVNFKRALDSYYDKLVKKFRARMRMLMEAGMVRLIRRTPVHTGAAVMSYVASSGQPFSGAPAGGRDPVEPTNRLPVGSERLRA